MYLSDYFFKKEFICIFGYFSHDTLTFTIYHHFVFAHLLFTCICKVLPFKSFI